VNNDPFQPCDQFTPDPKTFNCVCGVSEGLHPGGSNTFLGQLIQYGGRPDDVDHWVEWWHLNGGVYYEALITLRALLGLTKEQYTRWMHEGNQVLREFAR
jgi:hypothetical protein